MNQDFTYYAFISYSHKDEAWAKWIQESIERYRLPAIIRKEVKKPLPKKIQPVFLDQTDLGVGKLVDNLHQELEKSRFLIVVCSPNSAQPNAEGRHFIEEEVAHFCRLGREKQIIPVIVEGTPENAFCPKLKELDILALDATKKPKPRILNDLVATILGLRRDELWNRERRRQRQQRIRRSIFGAIVGVAATFIGLFAWDANRTVKNYYADYVDSFGLPEGIFPLRKSELRGRHIHYRFEYRGFQHGHSPHADSADWCIWNLLGLRRQLVRVVQANARGIPSIATINYHTTNFDVDVGLNMERPQIQDFFYDHLRLKEIKCKRMCGDIGQTYVYRRVEFQNLVKEYAQEIFGYNNSVVNGIQRFLVNEGQVGFSFQSAQYDGDSCFMQSGTARSSVAQYAVLRNDMGRVVRVAFLDNFGYCVDNEHAVSGISIDTDDIGRICEIRYINLQDKGYKNCENNRGGMGCCYVYNGKNLKYMELLAKDKRDNARVLFVYDNNDNLIESRHESVRGDLLAVDGYSIVRFKYNQIGNLISTIFYDNKGKKVEARSEHYAEEQMLWDDNGRLVSLARYDANGNPVLFHNECIAFRWKYKDNIFIEEYIDAYGNMMTNNVLGIVATHCEFDGNGNKVRVAYYDSVGKPMVCDGGKFAEVRWNFDARGNNTEESYHGLNGELVCHSLFQYAVKLMRYDKRGNVQTQIYLNAERRRMACSDGYAEIRFKYDEKGHQIEESYWDADGAPTLNTRLGVARVVWTYDNKGHIISRLYFDIHGNHISNKNSGEAITKYEYDMHGNKIREMLFDASGKPCLDDVGGWWQRCFEYDAQRRKIKETYFDIEGKRMRHSRAGVAEVRFEYDERGNCTTQAFFDTNGKPIEDWLGGFQRKYEYDRHDRSTREIYLDQYGKLMLTAGGYADVRLEKDEEGHTIKESYYGINGEAVLLDGKYAAIRWTYDADGNRRESYYGVDDAELWKVIVVKEIQAGSVAEKLGVKVGDIWCKLGSREFTDMRSFRDYRYVIQLMRDTPKTLIVARKSQDANVYEILSFDFPSGIMGILYDDCYLSDIGFLRCYDKWCIEQDKLKAPW